MLLLSGTLCGYSTRHQFKTLVQSHLPRLFLFVLRDGPKNPYWWVCEAVRFFTILNLFFTSRRRLESMQTRFSASLLVSRSQITLKALCVKSLEFWRLVSGRNFFVFWLFVSIFLSFVFGFLDFGFLGFDWLGFWFFEFWSREFWLFWLLISEPWFIDLMYV